MSSELRLALAMRGGVSLAVWIGGAVAEIDVVRRASLGERSNSCPTASEFWKRVLETTCYDRVAVDVLAGASAGGLNGVLYAASQVYDFSYDHMREVWLKVGSTEGLVRRKGPWPSLFMGDEYFLAMLHKELARLSGLHDVPPGTAADVTTVGGAPPVSRLHLELSATVLEPVLRPIPSPADEELTERRHASGFRFRQPEEAWLDSDFLPAGSEDFDVALWRLATAGRATSSYPLAFEAAEVHSGRRATFGAAPPTNTNPSVVAHDGTFLDRTTGKAFVIADGGILDNIPIRRALDAVARSPADGPTARVIVYLQPGAPSPPRATAALTGEARRSALQVIKGTISSRVAGETINADISAIEAHNEAVERAVALRRGAFEDVDSAGKLLSRAQLSWQSYCGMRATEDARRVFALLCDPVGELGSDPFPEAVAGQRVPDERWRSPIACWPQALREGLASSLYDGLHGGLKAAPADHFQNGTGGIRERLGEGERLPCPFTAVHDPEPLRRVAQLLIEWARYLEFRGVSEASGAKRQFYRVHAFIEEALVATNRHAWVAAAARADSGRERFTAAVLEHFDRLVQVDREDIVRAVEGLRYEDSRAIRDAVAAARDRVDDAVRAVLAELRSIGPDERTSPAENLLAAIGELLAALASELAAARGERWTPEVTDMPGPLFDRALSGSVIDMQMLAAVEVLCFPEFVSGLPARGPIDFQRCSSANRTPLATYFTTLQEKGAQTGLLWDPKKPSCMQEGIHVDLKLAGNELNNFAAFLVPEWRANDWFWGRLDSVPTLVDVLIRPRDLGKWLDAQATEDGGRVDAFMQLLQASDTAWSNELIEELWKDDLIQELRDLVRASPEQRDAVSTLAIRRALIARRQWDIARQEMRQESSPLGTPPVATESQRPTLGDVKAWLAKYAVGTETLCSERYGPALVETFSDMANSATEALLWNLAQDSSPARLPDLVARGVQRAGPRVGAMLAKRVIAPPAPSDEKLKRALTVVLVVAWILALMLGLALDRPAFGAGVLVALLPLGWVLIRLASWMRKLLSP